jgi:thioredoxin reductase (NADPH)
LFKNAKVTVLWDHTVQEILGEKAPAPLVKGVRVRNVKTGAEREFAADGVFVAIGHSPNTELFRGKLAMDSEGYLITRPNSTATDVEGVYAAGDVQDKIFRQAVTAAGTGCMAALEAEKWLARQEARLAQAAE